jgi:hypothetical protein
MQLGPAAGVHDARSCGFETLEFGVPAWPRSRPVFGFPNRDSNPKFSAFNSDFLAAFLRLTLTFWQEFTVFFEINRLKYKPNSISGSLPLRGLSPNP